MNKSPMNKSSAAVVAGWAAGNALLTVMLIGYGGPTLAWRAALFGGASFLALIAAVCLFVFRRRREPEGKHPVLPSGAPALAAAGAVLVGGFAWVFGVYIAYLAVPLLAYAVGKWLAEGRHHSETV